MKIAILVFVAAVGLPSVALAQGPSHYDAAPPAERADPTAEVLAAATVIVDAFDRHDPEAYFALFDPDATFLFYTTPHRLENRAAYEREWATWERELGFSVRSSASTDQRVQLFGDTAVFTHSVRTVISTNEGESTFDERETIVFHRRDDRWIAVHEHLSPAPEGSDAAASNELVPSDIAERLVGAWEAVEDQGCAEDASVVLYTVSGGGHTWPGGKPLPEWRVGPNSDSIDATSEMWSFFREHPARGLERRR